MTFHITYIPSFFGLGFGIERYTCYETGRAWHAKIFLGFWILRISSSKQEFNPR